MFLFYNIFFEILSHVCAKENVVQQSVQFETDWRDSTIREREDSCHASLHCCLILLKHISLLRYFRELNYDGNIIYMYRNCIAICGSVDMSTPHPGKVNRPENFTQKISRFRIYKILYDKLARFS